LGHDHAQMSASSSDSVGDFFSRLLDTDFMARGECVSWRPEIVWLHVASDAAIALAYYSIPIALVYYVRRRGPQSFNWMFLMFAMFILACGTTHVMSIVAFWHPLYRLDGVVKAFTAVVSVTTAIALWPLVPRALAVPRPSDLRRSNQKLESEMRERMKVESQLEAARADLERRVHERTAELEALNARLRGEVEERKRIESILRASEERFHVALHSGPFTVFNQDRELRYTWMSNPQMGMSSPDVIGKRDEDLFPPETAAVLTRLKREVIHSGAGAHAEVSVDVNGEARHFEFRAEPLRDAAGAVCGITGAKLDITERKRGERHRAFLLAELDHRVKNNLSVVLSLAEESVRASSSMPEFSRSFIGRVRALAKAHAALAASQWEGVELAELVKLTMDSYGSAGAGRVRTKGASIHLSPKAASAMCMTIHELMTNAVKHGAFATGAGVISLEWTTRIGSDGAPVLRMEWQESGGPPVAAPASRGLGTQLIEDGVAYELGGVVRTEYRPEGLHCTIEFPLNIVNTQRGRFEQEVSQTPGQGV
jgi:PAS domain S-box-containing protein